MAPNARENPELLRPLPLIRRQDDVDVIATVAAGGMTREYTRARARAREL